jgi:hypothetical protein
MKLFQPLFQKPSHGATRMVQTIAQSLPISTFLSIAALAGHKAAFLPWPTESRLPEELTLALQAWRLICLSNISSIAEQQDPALVVILVQLTSGSKHSLIQLVRALRTDRHSLTWHVPVTAQMASAQLQTMKIGLAL